MVIRIVIKLQKMQKLFVTDLHRFEKIFAVTDNRKPSQEQKYFVAL